MIQINSLKSLVLTASLLISPLSFADWKLNNDTSTVSFVSIKKSKVAEVHTFKKLEGTVTKKGAGALSIDLSSIESNISIRNERMQKYLFEITKHPTATVTTNIDPKKLNALKIGQTATINMNFELDLHGFKNTQTAEVTVIKTTTGLMVSTKTPIIINAADFELNSGIEKLKELAKLPSIGHGVPVTLSLQFDAQ